MKNTIFEFYKVSTKLLVLSLFIVCFFYVNNQSIGKTSDVKNLYWNPDISEIVEVNIGPNLYYPGYSVNKGEKTLKESYILKNKKSILLLVNAVNDAVIWDNLHPDFVTANRTFGPKKLTLKFKFKNNRVVAFKMRIIEEFKMVCLFEYFVVKKVNNIEYINRKKALYSQDIYKLLQSEIPEFSTVWVDA